MVEVDDEDLAVADLAGLGSGCDGVDGLVDLIGGNSDLDLDLGQETHGIFGAAIDFRVALLAAIPLDFRHRETVNANGGQGVTDFFELEWLDDRHNNFHGSYPRLGPVQTDRAFSTEVHHAEMFTTRAQPGPLESNAVPDRDRSLTDYESDPFRPLRELHVPAPFGRAQSVVRIAQLVSRPEPQHNPCSAAVQVVTGWAAYCSASPCCEISRPSSSCCCDTRSGANTPTS